MVRIPKNGPPTHPGEMLFKDFLKTLNMKQSDLVEKLGVSYPRENEVIHEKRGITPDTALRLEKLFSAWTPSFGLICSWRGICIMHPRINCQGDKENKKTARIGSCPNDSRCRMWGCSGHKEFALRLPGYINYPKSPISEPRDDLPCNPACRYGLERRIHIFIGIHSVSVVATASAGLPPPAECKLQGMAHFKVANLFFC